MSTQSQEHIAQWKTLAWQNLGIAQRYQVNIFLDQFDVATKNVREIALACEFAQGKVLDAGCGTGRFTIPLHDAGFDVTGLDVSDGMITVARQVAAHRPIPFVQGSIFDLPFDAGSFDSVISITVINHFPQWGDILREYARVLRPGGRMVFNLRSRPHVDFANRHGVRFGTPGHAGDPNWFMAEVEADDVIGTLRDMGATVTHLIPYGAFDSNLILQEALADGYDAAMAQLQTPFRQPGALELWDFLERSLFPALPIAVGYGFMVVAEVPGPAGAPAPWSPPPAIELTNGLFDATAIKNVLGAEFIPFKQGLKEHLRPVGAIRLLAALNNVFGPKLPIAIDFLSLLDSEDQARVLDQVAWDWTRQWHGSLGDAFTHSGAPLAPMMTYEVFKDFARILKPLTKETE